MEQKIKKVREFAHPEVFTVASAYGGIEKEGAKLVQ